MAIPPSVELLGIRLVGLNADNGKKVLLTLAVIAIALLLRKALSTVVGLGTGASRRSIWFRKYLKLAVGAAATLVVLSIWFDDPQRFATFSGLVAAGLAFASQQAILSIAGYFVIVFGKVFNLGDRIEVGEVRGDVLDIGLFKTTVMEMGVPGQMMPDPNHWIASRQYSGRVVTFANAEIFKSPVFNYSGTYGFLWEELRIPLKFDADLRTAERIILEAAQRQTSDIVKEGRTKLTSLNRKFLLHASDLEARTYLRITDALVEITVRFLVRPWGVRQLKDAMTREILQRFNEHHIEVPSTMIEIVGPSPVIRTERESSVPRQDA